jgi:hypothetical protein
MFALALFEVLEQEWQKYNSYFNLHDMTSYIVVVGFFLWKE